MAIPTFPNQMQPISPGGMMGGPINFGPVTGTLPNQTLQQNAGQMRPMMPPPGAMGPGGMPQPPQGGPLPVPMPQPPQGGPIGRPGGPLPVPMPQPPQGGPIGRPGGPPMGQPMSPMGRPMAAGGLASGGPSNSVNGAPISSGPITGNFGGMGGGLPANYWSHLGNGQFGGQQGFNPEQGYTMHLPNGGVSVQPGLNSPMGGFGQPSSQPAPIQANIPQGGYNGYNPNLGALGSTRQGGPPINADQQAGQYLGGINQQIENTAIPQMIPTVGGINNLPFRGQLTPVPGQPNPKGPTSNSAFGYTAPENPPNVWASSTPATATTAIPSGYMQRGGKVRGALRGGK